MATLPSLLPSSTHSFTILAEIVPRPQFGFFFSLWAKSFLHNEDGKLSKLAEKFHLGKNEMESDG